MEEFLTAFTLLKFPFNSMKSNSSIPVSKIKVSYLCRDLSVDRGEGGDAGSIGVNAFGWDNPRPGCAGLGPAASGAGAKRTPEQPEKPPQSRHGRRCCSDYGGKQDAQAYATRVF